MNIAVSGSYLQLPAFSLASSMCQPCAKRGASPMDEASLVHGLHMVQEVLACCSVMGIWELI